jgi:hypothetical protein
MHRFIVVPAWYPCRAGQIKGDTQSKQLYLPATDRYTVTYKTVVCFDAPAAAEAAGFRLAHR